MIGPRVTFILNDGTKFKLELYDRPPALIINLKGNDGGERKVNFIRNGPDSYRESKFEKDT